MYVRLYIYIYIDIFTYVLSHMYMYSYIYLYIHHDVCAYMVALAPLCARVIALSLFGKAPHLYIALLPTRHNLLKKKTRQPGHGSETVHDIVRLIFGKEP